MVGWQNLGEVTGFEKISLNFGYYIAQSILAVRYGAPRESEWTQYYQGIHVALNTACHLSVAPSLIDERISDYGRRAE